MPDMAKPTLSSIRAAGFRRWAGLRRRLRRGLLARFQLAGGLGLGSAFALAIFEPRWRPRLAANIASGSLLYLLILTICSLFFFVKLEDEDLNFRPSGIMAIVILFLFPFFLPCLPASAAWVACQASDAMCAPRMESMVELPPKSLDRAFLQRWGSSLSTPEAKALGYCQKEADWALANAQFPGARLRLSTRCAKDLAPVFLAIKPSPIHNAQFLQDASRALLSAPSRPVSINEDLLSVSTWASIWTHGPLGREQEPAAPNAPLRFWISYVWPDVWRKFLPLVLAVMGAIFFAYGARRGIDNFLKENAEEAFRAIEALSIEQASDGGQAALQAHNSPPAAPRRSNRL